MNDYCERCKHCHDDGLLNDEECCYYGEPNGCNHPNHGYGVIFDKYEALQMENAELRECLKEAIEAFVVDAASHVNYTKELNKWRAVLEGGNRAND